MHTSTYFAALAVYVQLACAAPVDTQSPTTLASLPLPTELPIATPLISPSQGNILANLTNGLEVPTQNVTGTAPNLAAIPTSSQLPTAPLDGPDVNATLGQLLDLGSASSAPHGLPLNSSLPVDLPINGDKGLPEITNPLNLTAPSVPSASLPSLPTPSQLPVLDKREMSMADVYALGVAQAELPFDRNVNATLPSTSALPLPQASTIPTLNGTDTQGMKAAYAEGVAEAEVPSLPLDTPANATLPSAQPPSLPTAPTVPLVNATQAVQEKNATLPISIPANTTLSALPTTPAIPTTP